MYRNCGEKFPSNGTGIFLASKTGRGLRLALVMQTNGTENLSPFGKNGKKIIPRKALHIVSVRPGFMTSLLRSGN